jgi:response regulator RpfG family c-di-GMP phosphodiesterase
LSNQRASILFVDDEHRIVNLLRMTFESSYTVFTATSGIEALDILSRHQIDVIVSDQRMPKMLGTEVLARAVTLSPATMRVLLTGYSDLAAIVGSVNEGEIFRFINKPWDPTVLRETIEEAVAASRISRASYANPVAGNSDAIAKSDQPYVMLIGESLADIEAMRSVVEEDHRTITALSITDAISKMERFDIGVIVADVHAGARATTEFVTLLKEHHPFITTVMLTGSEDSEFVIRLINSAQIFRFALKPLRRGSFRLSVAAAMKAHLRLRNNPALAARHKVAKTPSEVSENLFSSMVRGLQKLRSRIFASNHPA